MATDWDERISNTVLCCGGSLSDCRASHDEVLVLLREFAEEAAEMADSHGDFVVGRKIRDMLPPKKEDDVCPRCKGSFEQTGGRPANPPYICQKCFMETEED